MPALTVELSSTAERASTCSADNGGDCERPSIGCRYALLYTGGFAPARRPTLTDSDISSVTGRLWSSLMSCDPVAGVLLLSGVGAWPPPDGVG
jgi:hypothetical protein